MSVVRRPWFALPLVVVTLLSACATYVPGEPVPAVGFDDRPSDAAASPSPGRSPNDSPNDGADDTAQRAADQPLDTDRVRPCDLFSPADLEPLGGPHGQPHPGNPTPHSCTFALPAPDGAAAHSDAGRDTAAVGYHRPFAEAAQAQPDGVRTGVRGRASWLYCEVVDGFQTCTATTAVGSDRSLLTMVSLRATSAADAAERLHQLTTAALDKLPPASR